MKNKLKQYVNGNIIIIAIIILLNIIVASFHVEAKKTDLYLICEIETDVADTMQVFYTDNLEWKEERSQSKAYSNTRQKLVFSIPSSVRSIRLDIGTRKADIKIYNIKLKNSWKKVDLLNQIDINKAHLNQIEKISKEDTFLSINTNGIDPYIVVDVLKNDLDNLQKVNDYNVYIAKIGIHIVVCIVGIIFLKSKNTIKRLLKEILQNRGLVWGLAKNDFKTKYAGSYLGIIWAFIQPVITVLIYWFVFQVGFKSAPIDNFPFILWLVSGIVPWFFFADALGSATNCLLEYSYLVKKVVFKISILPIVKIISAFFVHLFFVGFTIVLFLLYGHTPTIYMIQVVYYSLCIFYLVLGITFATSAIIVFFKDLGQIIAIVLQIGMWMTPIMWSYNILSPKYQAIAKLNPLYYIVEGYRDSLINQVWFWERYNQTIYFWTVTTLCFVLGCIIFNKLKSHFADVL